MDVDVIMKQSRHINYGDNTDTRVKETCSASLANYYFPVWRCSLTNRKRQPATEQYTILMH